MAKAGPGKGDYEFLWWPCGVLEALAFILLSHLDENGHELWNDVGERGLLPYRLCGVGQGAEPEIPGSRGKAVPHQESGWFPCP